MAGSDGILLGSRPHPRAWGTFARLLARHTRELGDWTWGQAAVHLAGHPARRFGLARRGLLRDGYVADIAVLDPARVTDRADYAHPRRLAEGVDSVLVGGQLVLRDGQLTGATPGRALRPWQAA
jgi:N-acyl-D-amino-acid deacylase